MSSVSTAELAICAALCPLVLYILFKHGRSGILGWVYLFIFCSLRIIAGGMALSNSDSANMISNIGLSALLLATAGVLHEARTYRDADLRLKLEWTAVVVYHLLCVAGVGILASGSSGLQGGDAKSKDLEMVKTGISLLTVAWAILAGWCVLTLVRPGRQWSINLYSAGTKLLYCVVISLLFVGIRMVYTLVAFVTGDEKLSPITGLLAVRVVLAVVPELVVLVVLILGGLWTRNSSQNIEVGKTSHKSEVQE